MYSAANLRSSTCVRTSLTASACRRHFGGLISQIDSAFGHTTVCTSIQETMPNIAHSGGRSSLLSQPVTVGVFSGSGRSHSKHWNVRGPLPPGGSARIKKAPQSGQVGSLALPIMAIFRPRLANCLSDSGLGIVKLTLNYNRPIRWLRPGWSTAASCQTRKSLSPCVPHHTLGGIAALVARRTRHRRRRRARRRGAISLQRMPRSAPCQPLAQHFFDETR
jgi:hypothetical protein